MNCRSGYREIDMNKLIYPSDHEDLVKAAGSDVPCLIDDDFGAIQKSGEAAHSSEQDDSREQPDKDPLRDSFHRNGIGARNYSFNKNGDCGHAIV